MSVLNKAGASAALALAIACPAAAQEASPDVAPKRPSLEVLERIIETRTPQTRMHVPDAAGRTLGLRRGATVVAEGRRPTLRVQVCSHAPQGRRHPPSIPSLHHVFSIPPGPRMPLSVRHLLFLRAEKNPFLSDKELKIIVEQ